MRAIFTFFKATAIGGMAFLVPIVILALILNKALAVMMSLAEYAASRLHIEAVHNILVLNLISIAALILLCFIAGLLARTKLARESVGFLEDRFLDRIPFYLFVKSMTGGIPDRHEQVLTPVWARLDDYSQLAFEVERQEDGRVVVFLPGAPNPWSGTVAIFDADRITPSGMTMMAAIRNLSYLGQATRSLPHNSKHTG